MAGSQHHSGPPQPRCRRSAPACGTRPVRWGRAGWGTFREPLVPRPAQEIKERKPSTRCNHVVSQLAESATPSGVQSPVRAPGPAPQLQWDESQGRGLQPPVLCCGRPQSDSGQLRSTPFRSVHPPAPPPSKAKASDHRRVEPHWAAPPPPPPPTTTTHSQARPVGPLQLPTPTFPPHAPTLAPPPHLCSIVVVVKVVITHGAPFAIHLHLQPPLGAVAATHQAHSRDHGVVGAGALQQPYRTQQCGRAGVQAGCLQLGGSFPGSRHAAGASLSLPVDCRARQSTGLEAKLRDFPAAQCPHTQLGAAQPQQVHEAGAAVLTWDVAGGGARRSQHGEHR